MHRGDINSKGLTRCLIVTSGKSMDKLDCKNALASRANTIAEEGRKVVAMKLILTAQLDDYYEYSLLLKIAQKEEKFNIDKLIICSNKI